MERGISYATGNDNLVNWLIDCLVKKKLERGISHATGNDILVDL